MKIIDKEITTEFARGIALDLSVRVRNLTQRLGEAGFSQQEINYIVSTAGSLALASAEHVFLQALADCGVDKETVLAVGQTGADMAGMALESVGGTVQPITFFERMSREGGMGLTIDHMPKLHQDLPFSQKAPEGEN